MRAPPPPKSPWQSLYGWGHRTRRAWYETRAGELPRPVVSIGNLHWGGSGKTPVVAAIAAWLRDRGLLVAILSRGYKSRGDGVRVVSTGDGPLLGPLVAGDEAVLLAGRLPGVAVVVCPDRHEAGRHAMERLPRPPDLFLLDDGFSHVRLRRDLDLLVFPQEDPFGGGRLPPGGRLREPLASATHADALLLSGPAPTEAAELAEGLGRYGFRGPGFDCPVAVQPPTLTSGGILAAGSRVVLVAAIARPGRFRKATEDLGLDVVDALWFPDHHAYPEATLTTIRAAVRERGARYVLTTSKDLVKLQGRLDLPVAELPIEARPEPGFWSWLEQRLRELEVPLS